MLDRISEYSERQLRFPTDRLDAFMGILMAYQNLFPLTIRHLCGIIVLKPDKFVNFLRKDVSSMIGFGLSWSCIKHAVRNTAFPIGANVVGSLKEARLFLCTGYSLPVVMNSQLVSSLLSRTGTPWAEIVMSRNLIDTRTLSAV